MDEMVALFNIVVEGKVQFMPSTSREYILGQIQVAIEKEIQRILKSEIYQKEYGRDIWRFTPCSADAQDGGTLVRKVSELI